MNLFPFETDDIAAAVVERAKQINPKLKIMIGGAAVHEGRAHQTTLGDVWFSGMSDLSAVQYLDSLRGDKSTVSILPGELNFKTRKNNPTLREVPEFDFIHSMITWHESDHISPGEALPLEVSRGCIFNCKFCNYPKKNVKDVDYIKSPEVLYAELMYNYEKYGTTNYFITDDTHNDSMKKLEMINSVVKRLPFRFRFTSYLRHDLMYKNRDMAQLLLENGLLSCVFGIETLNFETGKLIGKGLHPDKTMELFGQTLFLRR